MPIHLYGIPNCDTVRKARKWLEARELEYAFHDFKQEGVSQENLEEWIGAAGLDVVFNRRGTTFRKLSDAEKAAADDRHTAVALLVQHPSMIKRPVAVHSGGTLVGFKEEEWSAAFS